MNCNYPIIWAEAKLILKTRRKYFVGICGYSKRVFKIATAKGQDVLTILVVNNLYLDEERRICEEGSRCLDFDCPFNKTTKESFAHSIGIKKLPAKLSNHWGERISQNTTQNGSLGSYVDLFSEHPSGGILMAKAKWAMK